MKGILESIAAIVDGLQAGEDSVEQILHVGVEGGSDCGGVFGLADSSGFETILEIGIISWFPFVLPSDVVGVAVGPADFVIANSL